MPRRRSVSLRNENTVHSPGPRARSTERSLRHLTLSPALLIPDRIHDDDDDDDDDDKLAETSLSSRSTEDSPTGDDALRDSMMHHRAMSDPLDLGGDGNNNKETGTTTQDGKRNGGLPTLPRFPCSETRDLNCWSEPGVDLFHVRGSRYLKDGRKVTSGPYLMRARGCDLLLVDGKSNKASSMTKNIGANPCVLGGKLRSAPTFIINFCLPWGVLAHYYQIPEKLCSFLGPNPPSLDTVSLSPAEKTLAKFFMGDDAYRNSRLKLVPNVAGGPWIVRSMVSGKPAIIGNKLPVSYTYSPPTKHQSCYLEADLDIGSSSKAAKRIVSVCRRYLNALTVDVGFVIQGNRADELPEQMLGSVRIHALDAMRAPSLKPCHEAVVDEPECAPPRRNK